MIVELVVFKDFENNVFEGYMFVEDMGKCGIDILCFGLFKLVGLIKFNGEKFYVVV